MFFRKLLSSSAEAGKKDGGEVKPAPPAGLQTMNATLQRKFARGVQYNMKIIIKGDRNVGKTAFFHRLQGEKFKEEYIPTDEIQVTCIPWNYKATDDIVKVEVWDVVDKGKSKKKIEGLKLANEKQVTPDVWEEGVKPGQIKLPEAIAASPFEAACLDAEFVDVYKGTHGVIMLLDITKQWTFEYVARELPKVPPAIPVLILANHRDMGHHRTVTEETIRYLAEEVQTARGEEGGPVRYCESSMRNGFGLKYVHKYFNLPFLQLQRETLLKQLETNRRETALTVQELDLQEESEEMDYESFIESLSAKRRQNAESLAGSAVKEARSVDEAKSAPSTPATTPTASDNPVPPASVPKDLPLPMTTSSKSAPVTPATTPVAPEKPTSFMSKLFSRKEKPREPEKADEVDSAPPAQASMPKVQSVDDFCPEEGLDASFLDDVRDSKTTVTSQSHEQESDSDNDTGNPMVAGFCEDLESDDETPAKTVEKPVKTTEKSAHKTYKKPAISSRDIELSSDEDSDDIVNVPRNTHIIAQAQSDIDSDDMTDRNKRSSAQKLSNSMTDSLKTKRDVSSSQLYNGASFKKKNSDTHIIESSVAQIEHKTTSQTVTIDTDRSNKQRVGDNRGVSDDNKQKADEALTPTSHSADEDSETESANQAVVMCDVEDISEEEMTSRVDEDRDTLIDDETPGKTEDTKTSGLEFEDLSVLEQGFDFTTGLPRADSSGMSRSATEPDLDSAAVNKKKKKKKDRSRDNEKEESSRSHHKKKKKHKERERDKNEDSNDSSEKSKKRKSKRPSVDKEAQSELEKFLGPDVEVAMPAGEGYESL